MFEWVKVWKEDNRIIIRSDIHHITTYGKNLQEALKNFYDAYLLNVGKEAPASSEEVKNLTISMQLSPAEMSYGRQTTRYPGP